MSAIAYRDGYGTANMADGVAKKEHVSAEGQPIADGKRPEAESSKAHGENTIAGAASDTGADFSWTDPHPTFVTIKVGKSQQPFGIQQDFLCAWSGLYRRQFAQPSGAGTEGSARVVWLPDTTVEVFGMVQNFMYTGKVITDTKKLPTYDTLAGAWKVGNDLEMLTLCEMTLEAMMTCRRLTELIPATPLISQVWKDTPPGSSIRKLLVGWAVEYMCACPSPEEFAKTLPSEAVIEIAVAMSLRSVSAGAGASASAHTNTVPGAGAGLGAGAVGPGAALAPTPRAAPAVRRKHARYLSDSDEVEDDESDSSVSSGIGISVDSDSDDSGHGDMDMDMDGSRRAGPRAKLPVQPVKARKVGRPRKRVKFEPDKPVGGLNPGRRSLDAGMAAAAAVATPKKTGVAKSLAAGKPATASPKIRSNGVQYPYSSITTSQQMGYCSDLITRMMSGPGFWTRLVGPFKHPVDPELDGVPDYLERIKRPMDLTTIKEKMDRGEYATPDDFYADVDQIFTNCYTYWNRGDTMWDACEKLQKTFLERYSQMNKWIKKANLAVGDGIVM